MNLPPIKHTSDTEGSMDLKALLFDLYKRSYQLKQAFPEISIPAPKFLLIGSQSAGKSSVSELLAGFPINVIKNEIGTRRPLEVICEYDESREVPLCTIQGQGVVPMEQVALKVAMMNDLLAGKGGSDEGTFSNEYIRLRIQSKHVMNLIFVDPPGLRVDGSKEARMIEDILRENMRDPDNIVVCVLATDDFGNQRALSFLKETKGEEWLHATDILYIMPHFDKVVRQCHTGETANNMMAGYVRPPWLMPIHLIAWAYDVGSNPTFQAREKHLKDIPGQEKKQVTSWIARINEESRHSSVPEFDIEKYGSRMGWDRVLLSFQTRLSKMLMKYLPRNLDALRDLMEKTEDDIARYENLLKETDTSTLKSLLIEYTMALSRAVGTYLSGDVRAGDTLGLENIAMTLPQELDLYRTQTTWNEMDFGYSNSTDEKRWEETVEKYTSGQTEWSRVPEWNNLLYGGRQYKRALVLFNTILEQSLATDMDDEMIANAVGHMAANHGFEDWERAVTKLVTVLMARAVHPAINYIVKKSGFLCVGLLNIGMWHLAKTQYESLAERFATDTFYKLLQQCCTDYIKEVMKDCATHAHQAAKASYLTVSPDLHLLVGSSTTPVDWLKSKRSAVLNKDAIAHIKDAVRKQVDVLFRLNKINLNNTLNTLFFKKFRDGLATKLLVGVNNMSGDELTTLFGLSVGNIQQRLDRLRKKLSEIRDVTQRYKDSQKLIQSLK